MKYITNRDLLFRLIKLPNLPVEVKAHGDIYYIKLEAFNDCCVLHKDLKLSVSSHAMLEFLRDTLYRKDATFRAYPDKFSVLEIFRYLSLISINVVESRLVFLMV